MKNTFKKEERLKSRKSIGKLFSEGQSFGQYPLRLVFIKTQRKGSEFPVQFALSVPRKRFKKAVDRNRLRRQIREAYRLHKHRLYQGLSAGEETYAWMIIYIGQEALPYQEIEKAMQQIIKRFLKKQRAMDSKK